MNQHPEAGFRIKATPCDDRFAGVDIAAGFDLFTRFVQRSPADVNAAFAFQVDGAVAARPIHGLGQHHVFTVNVVWIERSEFLHKTAPRCDGPHDLNSLISGNADRRATPVCTQPERGDTTGRIDQHRNQVRVLSRGGNHVRARPMIVRAGCAAHNGDVTAGQ